MKNVDDIPWVFDCSNRNARVQTSKHLSPHSGCLQSLTFEEITHFGVLDRGHKEMKKNQKQLIAQEQSTENSPLAGVGWLGEKEEGNRHTTPCEKKRRLCLVAHAQLFAADTI